MLEVNNLRSKKRKAYRNKSDLNPDSGARHKKKNKKRYLENKKEKFRKSKEWKEFRGHMAKLFNHRDYITGRRLVKGFNVHHLRTDQDSDNYCDISHDDEFIPLNSYCHKMLHYLFIYYQKDPTVMDRIKEILDKMCQLAPNYAVEPIEDIDEAIEEAEEDEDELAGEEKVEITVGSIEETQPEYDIPEQEPDVIISSEELGEQLLPKPEN